VQSSEVLASCKKNRKKVDPGAEGLQRKRRKSKLAWTEKRRRGNLSTPLRQFLFILDRRRKRQVAEKKHYGQLRKRSTHEGAER